MGYAEARSDRASRHIASLVYKGPSAQIWNIPSQVVDVDPLPPPSAPLRSFVLGGRGMGQGGSFSINGQRFDATRIDTDVPLNAVEDWEYVNPTAASHPMHLHVNAFQILDEAGPTGARLAGYRGCAATDDCEDTGTVRGFPRQNRAALPYS